MVLPAGITTVTGTDATAGSELLNTKVTSLTGAPVSDATTLTVFPPVVVPEL